MSRPLLDNESLEASSIVANCRMNRERQLRGGNGYVRELGLDPVEHLRAHPGRWLDLCCGTGRALFEAAEELGDDSDIVGVDLVDTPWRHPLPAGLRLHVGPVRGLEHQRCSLITCVHGLAYIGDTLGTLERIASWLMPEGRFAASFDPDSVRDQAGQPLAGIRPLLTSHGFRVARKRITRVGGGRVHFGVRYLGADDRAGPSWTGQPAVHGHYCLDGDG